MAENIQIADRTANRHSGIDCLIYDSWIHGAISLFYRKQQQNLNASLYHRTELMHEAERPLVVGTSRCWEEKNE